MRKATSGASRRSDLGSSQESWCSNSESMSDFEKVDVGLSEWSKRRLYTSSRHFEISRSISLAAGGLAQLIVVFIEQSLCHITCHRPVPRPRAQTFLNESLDGISFVSYQLLNLIDVNPWRKGMSFENLEKQIPKLDYSMLSSYLPNVCSNVVYSPVVSPNSCGSYRSSWLKLSSLKSWQTCYEKETDRRLGAKVAKWMSKFVWVLLTVCQPQLLHAQFFHWHPIFRDWYYSEWWGWVRKDLSFKFNKCLGQCLPMLATCSQRNHKNRQNYYYRLDGINRHESSVEVSSSRSSTQL